MYNKFLHFSMEKREKIAISLQQYDHLHKIWHNDAERVSRIHQLSKLTFKNPRWRTADALETSRLVDLQDDGLYCMRVTGRRLLVKG